MLKSWELNSIHIATVSVGMRADNLAPVSIGSVTILDYTRFRQSSLLLRTIAFGHLCMRNIDDIAVRYGF